MRTLISIIAALLFISVHAQQYDPIYDTDPGKVKSKKSKTEESPITGDKLFGDIYYGMTKKEVKEAISNNKEANSLTVGDQKLVPVVGYSIFNGKSQIQTYAMMTAVDFGHMLSDKARNIFLVDIDTMLVSTGFTREYKHEYWPNSAAMSGEDAAIYSKDEKLITVYCAEPNITAYFTVYPAYVFITLKEHLKEVGEQKDNQMKSDIEKAKEKF